jgi:peptide/nickel transport system substrate-binding protein
MESLKSGKIKMARSFILLVIGLVALSACVEAETLPPARSSITYGLTLEPSGFDPHRNQSSELGIVARQVYDTLVYRHPDTMEIVPGLASSWAISDDGLVYTFTLRQGVIFHDGTPFNAQAVAANLDRIINPATASQRARFMLGSFQQYTIIDDYTIQLILATPYVPLLDSLAQVYLAIASPAALNAYTPETYQFHQVGTGPFRFIEYVPGDRIVLRRSDTYTWGPDFYGANSGQAGLIDEIIFRFYRDESTRAAALQAGDAQIMGEMPPIDARALTGNSEIQLIPTDIPGQPLQFLINTALPPTDDLAVRQALLYATNRSAIIDRVYQSFSPIAWGPLSSPTLYFNRDVMSSYSADAVQARTLLESAGYSDANNDGLFDNLELRMIVPSWGRVPQVAELIRLQWREVGIDLELMPVAGFPALQEAVNEGQYHLVSFDTPGYDPAFLSDYFVTGGVRNYSAFSDPDLDNVLVAAVQEAVPGVRRAMVAEVQRYIMEQALIIPIREYVNINAADASIRGLRFDPYGWFPLLNDVYIER